MRRFFPKDVIQWGEERLHPLRAFAIRTVEPAGGMLNWHLGNFPVKRWPPRVALFLVIEVFAEMGTSSLLIAVARERGGSRVALWADWWPMAGQTFIERTIVLVVFALVLGGTVQLVRRAMEPRDASTRDASTRDA